ncbi:MULTISPECIES: GIY-YIG nuclease family protein [Flavobacterium]|uniref:GIY-YIG nuclease family protein n=1 Tax=Flavobacterium quisquiliarum TaxID=1834436 RepID=A0ABV8WEJ3_9FLAO|nr:GIY-YIG nuclease family protein [Flavobacterium panacagri]NWL04172.1 excinuclease ABC subunit C [Flavobacterium collinsii]
MFGFFALIPTSMFFVYILYSTTKEKFYIGQTNDIEDRLRRHNSGQSLSTKNGIPWKIIYTIQLDSRSEAVTLESKIKKRGAKRYLQDIDFKYQL